MAGWLHFAVQTSRKEALSAHLQGDDREPVSAYLSTPSCSGESRLHLMVCFADDAKRVISKLGADFYHTKGGSGVSCWFVSTLKSGWTELKACQRTDHRGTAPLEVASINRGLIGNDLTPSRLKRVPARQAE